MASTIVISGSTLKEIADAFEAASPGDEIFIGTTGQKMTTLADQAEKIVEPFALKLAKYVNEKLGVNDPAADQYASDALEKLTAYAVVVAQAKVGKVLGLK